MLSPNRKIMISTKIIYNAVFKTEAVDDLDKFQALPKPTGSYPYRLSVDHQDAGDCREMIFHMVGDTGGTNSPGCQQRMAGKMAEQYLCALAGHQPPAFLYHLGDIVYHYGEAEQYAEQFLKPFDTYPGQIYAIAGNHDTDVNLNSNEPYETLDAFYTAFCNVAPKTIHFGKGNIRKSQVQPHVYWTMQAPLATIIGLHTNVPKYGHVDREQKNWFIKELRHAALFHQEKAIIVCMHHAPYSADVNHGSSEAMISFLEEAFEESGVKPDVVFSGHVHNYQRFSKSYSDGKSVPFIVAGAGGFDELHQLADPCDPTYQTENDLLKGIRLEQYCDDSHGFLKIAIQKSPFNFQIQGEYFIVPENPEQDAVLFDQFNIDLTGR